MNSLLNSFELQNSIKFLEYSSQFFLFIFSYSIKTIELVYLSLISF